MRCSDCSKRLKKHAGVRSSRSPLQPEGKYTEVGDAFGARRGELCALSWNDVDFEGRTLTIAQSLSQTKGCIALKGTKTGSVRRLSLSRLALEALRRQRAMQAQDKLLALGTYVDEGAVFATPQFVPIA